LPSKPIIRQYPDTASTIAKRGHFKPSRWSQAKPSLLCYGKPGGLNGYVFGLLRVTRCVSSVYRGAELVGPTSPP